MRIVLIISWVRAWSCGGIWKWIDYSAFMSYVYKKSNGKMAEYMLFIEGLFNFLSDNVIGEMGYASEIYIYAD